MPHDASIARGGAVCDTSIIPLVRFKRGVALLLFGADIHALPLEVVFSRLLALPTKLTALNSNLKHVPKSEASPVAKERAKTCEIT